MTLPLPRSIPLSPVLLHKAQAVRARLAEGPAEAVTTLPSPCVNICCLDATEQWCLGCLRTLEELRQWGSADAATQRRIWQRILVRLERAAGVQGVGLSD